MRPVHLLRSTGQTRRFPAASDSVCAPFDKQCVQRLSLLGFCVDGMRQKRAEDHVLSQRQYGQTKSGSSICSGVTTELRRIGSDRQTVHLRVEAHEMMR